jgi:hypothetical protein
VLFAADPIDSFLDANRPKDLAEVERLARDAVAVPERAAKAAGSGE